MRDLPVGIHIKTPVIRRRHGERDVVRALLCGRDDGRMREVEIALDDIAVLEQASAPREGDGGDVIGRIPVRIVEKGNVRVRVLERIECRTTIAPYYSNRRNPRRIKRI